MADQNIIKVQSASRANYEGMLVLSQFDRDGRGEVADKVFLGKVERYDGIGGYDNSDGSLVYISDNRKMFSFLDANEGWVVSQQALIESGDFSAEDYAEFDRLKETVLAQYKEVKPKLFGIDLKAWDGGKFNGVPFRYPDWQTGEERAKEETDMAQEQINLNEMPIEEIATLDYVNNPDRKGTGGVYRASAMLKEVIGWEIAGNGEELRLDALYKRYDDAWTKANLKDDFKPKIAILQLREGEENVNRRFLGMDSLNRIMHEEPNCDNYELVYVRDGVVETFHPESVREKQCNELYGEFNFDGLRPRDYYGHSLSVGDVIVFMGDFNEHHAYFVDNVDFKKLPDAFLTHTMAVRIRNDLDIREEGALYESISRYQAEHALPIMDDAAQQRYFQITSEYARIFELADRRGMIMDMEALGFDYDFAPGGSVIYWQTKGEPQDRFATESWDDVRNFIDDIKTLQETYSLEQLQDIAAHDYDYSDVIPTYGERKLHTAIATYPQREQQREQPNITVLFKDEKNGLEAGINADGNLYFGGEGSGYNLPDTIENRQRIEADIERYTGQKADLTSGDYRFQVQAIYEYEEANNIPENDRMTKWSDDYDVSVAKPWYKENDPSVMDRALADRHIGISEALIAQRFAEIRREQTIQNLWDMVNSAETVADVSEAEKVLLDADISNDDYNELMMALSAQSREAYRENRRGEPIVTMETAKQLINDFCLNEYGSEANFDNLKEVGIAYTTVEDDDQIPIQANVNLVDFRIERYLDNRLIETRQYGSLAELISGELEDLDFDDLTSVSEEEIALVKAEAERTAEISRGAGSPNHGDNENQSFAAQIANGKFPRLEYIAISDTVTGWKDNGAKDYGEIPGYVRGYNIEFQHRETGEINYNGAIYVEGTIEQYYQRQMDAWGASGYTPFEMERFNGWEPTGKAVMRGYAKEEYDIEERETFVVTEGVAEEIEQMMRDNHYVLKDDFDPHRPFAENVREQTREERAADLAYRLDELSRDIDTYGYQDAIGPDKREAHRAELTQNILAGNIADYTAWVEDAINDGSLTEEQKETWAKLEKVLLSFIEERRENMTAFEQLCDRLGAKPNSEEGKIISGMVNDLIFDSSRTYTDEEIIATVIERFNREYSERRTQDSITFYVAEVMEFPNMGEYHERLTLKEALDLYEQIPAERMNGGKGIGFELHDGSIYDGMQYALMQGTVVQEELINGIEHYRNSPLVQKAIQDCKDELARRNEREQSASNHPKITLSGQMREIEIDHPAEEPLVDISDLAYDGEGYLHFTVNADGYALEGLYRVYDPENGEDMKLVGIDYGDRHPIIERQWSRIEDALYDASLDRYNALIDKNFEHKDRVIQAMALAGYVYNEQQSADGRRFFDGGKGGISFVNFAEADRWIEGYVALSDDDKMYDEYQHIMYPERYDLSHLTDDQRRTVQAMEVVGYEYDATANMGAVGEIVFRQKDNPLGYPIAFRTWDEARDWIDRATFTRMEGGKELLDAKTKILYPEPQPLVRFEDVDGRHYEYEHDLYFVADVKDGVVYLQNVNNDYHTEIPEQRFIARAVDVTERDRLWAENPVGERDWYFNNPERGEVFAVHFNPDSYAGGQYVQMYIPYELILEAAKENSSEAFFDLINERAKQELVDIDTPEFKELMEHYKTVKPDFVYESGEFFAEGEPTMRKLIEVANAELNKTLVTVANIERRIAEIDAGAPLATEGEREELVAVLEVVANYNLSAVQAELDTRLADDGNLAMSGVGGELSKYSFYALGRAERILQEQDKVLSERTDLGEKVIEQWERENRPITAEQNRLVYAAIRNKNIPLDDLADTIRQALGGRFEPMPNHYYEPDLDLSGTADELFTQARNGYIERPEALAKLQEILSNPVEQKTEQAFYVGVLKEIAENSEEQKIGEDYSLPEVKKDILDGIGTIYLTPERNLSLEVRREGDTVLLALTDEETGAVGATTVPVERFLNMTAQEFNETVNAVYAYNMVEQEREEPEREREERSEEMKEAEPIMVETNMGKIPVEDYREIVAQQHGFDSYDEMYAAGIRIGNGYDKEPEANHGEDEIPSIAAEKAAQEEILDEGRATEIIRAAREQVNSTDLGFMKDYASNGVHVALTEAEARQAIKLGVRVDLISSVEDYHGSHEDDYSKIRLTEKNVDEFFSLTKDFAAKKNSFYSMYENTAYLSPDYKIAKVGVPELKRAIQYFTEQENLKAIVAEKSAPVEIDTSLAPKDQLKQRLENGVRSVLDSENFKNWLSTGGKLFYNNYSFQNAMLVWLQKPEASYVMGYEKWKDYGRNVVQGAVGAKVFVPLMASEKFKGALFRSIKSNLSDQLAKDSSLAVASYRLGSSNLEFTMNRANHAIGFKVKGVEQQIFGSDDEVKRFIDRAIIGKVPTGFTVGSVFDAKDVAAPEHLWVRSGFTKEEVVTDEKGNPIKNKRGETKIVNTPERQARFQPDLDTRIAAKDPEKMQKLFEACVAASERKGVPVSLAEKGEDEVLKGGAKGYFSRAFTEDKPNGFIVIDNSLEITEKCAVLLHEMGHADLHKNLDALAQKMGEEKIPKAMREVQAEAVAFSVASTFGLETDTSSFNYLAAYSRGFELQDFQKSLDVIYRESQALTADIKAELDIRGLNLDLTEKPKEMLDKETLATLSTKYLDFAKEQGERVQAAFDELPGLIKQSQDNPDLMDVLKYQKTNLDTRRADLDSMLTFVESLNEADTREKQDEVPELLEAAMNRVSGNGAAFEGLSERYVTISEQARGGLKADFDKHPGKTLEAMKKDYPALAALSKPQLQYIAASKFVSRELSKLLRNDPQKFVDKVTERAGMLSKVAAKNGTFVEVSFCEQWTKNPIFEQGTLCSPKIADTVVKGSEAQVQGLKAEAEKRGEYFPYVKCDVTVYTPNKDGGLTALHTRVDIGDGAQTGLKDHLEQVCKRGAARKELLANFQEALTERANKNKIKVQDLSEKPQSAELPGKGVIKEGNMTREEWAEQIASAKEQDAGERSEESARRDKSKSDAERDRR